MTEEEELSDLRDLWNERGYLKRSCRQRKKEETEPEEYSDLEVEEGEITDDPDSDRDYDPANRPKKNKKKVKLKEKEPKKREPRPKKKQFFAPPSFDAVMHSQISHLARFIEYYDEYDSYGESSSISEDNHEPSQKHKKVRTPSPVPEPAKERKKRIVIYPWRPIGITGGSGTQIEESYLNLRKPVNDVRTLIAIENQY